MAFSTMRVRVLQRWSVTILLILSLISIATVLADESEEEEEELQLYLYEEDAGKVIEYILPEKSATVDPEKPDFLYAPNQGYRIVEFYAPWCPHCQAFRDHFVEFAQQMEDYVGPDTDLTVHSVSCVAHRTLCHDWDVHGYPRLLLFTAGATNYTKIASYFELHPFDVLADLGIEIDQTKMLGETASSEETTAATSDKKISGKLKGSKEATGTDATTKIAYKRTKEDVYNDAFLSFHFALRTGIFMTNGPLSKAQEEAFGEWLLLLHRTLPPTWHIQSLIRAITNDFEKVVQSEANLLEIVDKFPPPKKKWSLGCSHGEKGNGYTCGLWELFHIVTVGFVEWNRLIQTDDWSMVMGSEDAAVSIRNYIENFFACDVCRMNFLLQFDTCAHDRCSRLNNDAGTVAEWKELPVWLFETHNSVNVRLMHESAEREKRTPTLQDEIDVQWPSRKDCQRCWREDGSWDEENAFRYLRLMYW
jgi:thiol-disulfide isomerase/thioredoxin